MKNMLIYNTLEYNRLNNIIKSRKYAKLYAELINSIKIESLSKDILNMLENFLGKNCVVDVNNNRLYIIYDNSSLIITPQKNGFEYEESKNGQKVFGKYYRTLEGFYNVEKTLSSRVYNSEESIYYSNVTKDEFRNFDKNGLEQFRKTTTMKDEYSENKLTGERTYLYPYYIRNYESCYLFRKGEYVLKRKIEKRLYPEIPIDKDKDIYRENGLPSDTDTYYIRFELIDDKTKELKNVGNFYGITNEVFSGVFKDHELDDATVDSICKRHYRHHVDYA